MNTKDFTELVHTMRERQREYFKNHTQSALAASIQAERRVDDAIKTLLAESAAIPSQQPALFAPDLAPALCTCGHEYTEHVSHGPCSVIGCRCHSYYPHPQD